jgi:two-component system, OmpR family, sensor histidine kinase KdpD
VDPRVPLVALVGIGMLIAVLAALLALRFAARGARRSRVGDGAEPPVAPAARSTTVDERVDEVRNALLTAVSHDLRTPLASIKAAATSILSSEVEWSPDAIRLWCLTIDEEADRLNGLVGNLIDMSRLHTGSVAVSKRVTAVDEIVDGAIARLPRSCPIAVALPGALPLVEVDAVLVGRAVANVLDNAQRWSSDRGRVAITGEAERDGVVLRVVDHGPGISALRRELVLRPLQQLGDGPGASHGLGLGLAVASGLVEANGGALALDDTPGGGLTVSIRLPAAAKVPR